MRLSDFKPISLIELPGLGKLETSGLILIVGPNSAGKSQLLQDIYNRFIGEPRNLVVATDIRVQKPEYPPFLEALKHEGYVETFVDDGGNKYIRPRTTHSGMGVAAAQIAESQAESWLQTFPDTPKVSQRQRNEFFSYFGRLLTTALFLDRRLIAGNQVGMFDHQTQQPQTDLHALYVDEDAKRELTTEIAHSFGRGLWPDASRGNTLCLRVSDDANIPTAEQRLAPREMGRFRTIETEGDGLKSYVATCIALLLGRRPVCVIDEPEMCLHPPQAYNLGRFIGRFGASRETVTFVATHSSHLLRGVLQTAARVQIVRLTRRGAAFHAHLVSAETLEESLARPTVRAESVLDGIFAQAVVIVEADSDRTLYQSVWESLSNEFFLDIHFAAVGGTGGIADTCNLYRTLQIPLAVVADLDLLTDDSRIARVVNALSVDKSQRREFLQRAASVSRSLRDLPPTLTPEAIRSELATLSIDSAEWHKGEDERIRKTLSDLAHGLDKMRRLKRGGFAALPDSVRAEVEGLANDLKSIGLFLVPVGELEEWLNNEGLKASKATKWAWANEAAQFVKVKGSQPGDVWDFLRGVGKFLLGDV